MATALEQRRLLRCWWLDALLGKYSCGAISPRKSGVICLVERAQGLCLKGSLFAVRAGLVLSGGCQLQPLSCLAHSLLVVLPILLKVHSSPRRAEETEQALFVSLTRVAPEGRPPIALSSCPASSVRFHTMMGFSVESFLSHPPLSHFNF